MDLDVRIMQGTDCATLMGTTMDLPGHIRFMEFSTSGLIATEEQPWFALNVAVKQCFSVMHIGKQTMDIPVKIMQIITGANLMEVIMVMVGTQNMEPLITLLIAEEEQLWFVLNVAVKQLIDVGVE